MIILFYCLANQSFFLEQNFHQLEKYKFQQTFTFKKSGSTLLILIWKVTFIGEK